MQAAVLSRVWTVRSTSTDVRVRARAHIFLYVFVSACGVRGCLRLCLCLCVYVFMCLCVYVFMCRCVSVCVCVWCLCVLARACGRKFLLRINSLTNLRKLVHLTFPSLNKRPFVTECEKQPICLTDEAPCILSAPSQLWPFLFIHAIGLHTKHCLHARTRPYIGLLLNVAYRRPNIIDHIVRLQYN